MALQTFKDGDRLIEMRQRFIKNFELMIAASVLMDAADYDLNVGRDSLILFRDKAEALMVLAGTDLTVSTLSPIVDGDRIYTLREKFNTNFALLNAVAGA